MKEQQSQMEKDEHHVELNGRPDVYVSVEQPEGGRYVCDITIETENERIILSDMHCDVADTLRAALDKVAHEFSKGYDEDE